MYHVPLVPRDADREETMFRIDQAITKLGQVSNAIFDKVESKITKIHKMAVEIDARTDVLEKKLEKLKESTNVITITLPPQLPPPTAPQSGSTSLFRINVDTEYLANSEELQDYKRADDHVLRPCEPIDFTAELNRVDKFFLTSQVMREYEQKGWERYKRKLLAGLRELPSSLDDMDIAELFFAGTSIPAYSDVSGDFIQQHLDTDDSSTRKSGRNDEEMGQQRLHEQLLEDTALGNGMETMEEEDDHPLAFRVERRAESELKVDMPESLPNLKGHAQNFTIRSLNLSDDDLLLPVEESILESEVTEPLVKTPEATTPTPITFSLPDPPPITRKMTDPPTSSSFSPIPPPPPPPPLIPVDPPRTPSKSIDNSAASAASGTDGRADLMAAIRAAGGASNAKLNKTEEKKRKGKYEGILEASALEGTPKASGGNSGSGDLMSALSKALDARRKAISGKTDRPSTSAQKSSSIPAPPHFSDDEWD